MAEVKWIKFIVGTFDGDSFKRIRRARIGGEKFRDKLTAVWFELLELAGKSNQNGMLIDADGIPYRGIEDIATMIDRETEEVELCMQFYIKEKMIEIIDDIYTLANWEKYQNVKGLEDIREANRIRNIAYRKRKKQLLLAENDKRDITQDITMTESLSRDIDKELDIDIERDLKESKKVSNLKKETNNTHTCVSYDEILDDFCVKGVYREAIIRFIKHLLANGIVMINDRLENLIIKVDRYYDDSLEKAKMIDEAINKGYMRLECEVDE